MESVSGRMSPMALLNPSACFEPLSRPAPEDLSIFLLLAHPSFCWLLKTGPPASAPCWPCGRGRHLIWVKSFERQFSVFLWTIWDLICPQIENLRTIQDLIFPQIEIPLRYEKSEVPNFKYHLRYEKFEVPNFKYHLRYEKFELWKISSNSANFSALTTIGVTMLLFPVNGTTSTGRINQDCYWQNP